MSTNDQDVMGQIKSGNLDLAGFEKLSASAASAVTISGWEVCYSSATGQLSGYCTVAANNSGDTITGIGFVIYKQTGSPMICLQYSNGLSDAEISTSVGTNLYTTSMGSSVLCIVYGYTQNSGSYFFSQTLPVGSC